ncbi:hypothetical protein DM02DRAFT_626857 [Periconia macrospinosa]|uniref:Uncharacterized protein n=1 Tax=Periconia macrospinosa TaxID=97972 RepID=A0A2V1DVH4_9PLEO|nr:hypothetical protein DM02DRAFT_626857 [Periconia macrospinosa]
MIVECDSIDVVCTHDLEGFMIPREKPRDKEGEGKREVQTIIRKSLTNPEKHKASADCTEQLVRCADPSPRVVSLCQLKTQPSQKRTYPTQERTVPQAPPRAVPPPLSLFTISGNQKVRRIKKQLAGHAKATTTSKRIKQTLDEGISGEDDP